MFERYNKSWIDVEEKREGKVEGETVREMEGTEQGAGPVGRRCGEGAGTVTR